MHRGKQLVLGLASAWIALGAIFAVSTQHPMISGALAQTDFQAGHDVGHDPLEASEPLYDGSVRPQDIADSLAISVLMHSLRPPNGSGATALNQLEARLRRVNLSDDDFAVLTSELANFDVEAKVQEARIETVRPFSVPGISAASARFLEDRYLEEQRNLSSLAVDRYEDLLESLSPEGNTSLREHLQHVKTRIRVYAPPDMTKQTL